MEKRDGPKRQSVVPSGHTLPSLTASAAKGKVADQRAAQLVARRIIDGPASRYPLEEVRGEPFAKGPRSATDIEPTDVLQGELADCTFLSACAAIARANSEAIRRLIFDNGDGTYDVTLYVSDGFWSSKSPHVIKVDSRFPSKHGHPAYARQGDAGPRGPELWVMLLEKAFATFQGQYEGGSGIESGHDWTGLEALLPQSSSTYHTMFHTQSHMLEQITQALREKRPIVAGTNPILLPSSRERARSLGISSSHAYSVKSTNPGSATISLQDPRGAVDLDELSMEDFNHFFTDYSIGPAL